MGMKNPSKISTARGGTETSERKVQVVNDGMDPAEARAIGAGPHAASLDEYRAGVFST